MSGVPGDITEEGSFAGDGPEALPPNPSYSGLDPDYAASLDFLRCWNPDQAVLTAILPDHREVPTVTATFDPTHDEQAILAWLAKWGADRNIYFTVNPVRKPVSSKPARIDIAEVRWLHVDIDSRAGEPLEDELKRIRALIAAPPGLPPPTFVIYSGGGYQAFWKLAVPRVLDGTVEDADDAARWNRRIEQILGGDHCHNIDRIMRLPGTLNRPDATKLAKGRRVALARVLHHAPELVYSVDQLSPADPANAPTARPAPERPAPPERHEGVPPPDLAELPAALPSLCLDVIRHGQVPGEPHRWPSRSEGVHYVCCELLRRGCGEAQIVSILLNPAFGISESVREKGRRARQYAAKQVQGARKDIAKTPAVSARTPVDSAKLFRLVRSPPILHHNGEWLQYNGVAYACLEDNAIRADVYDFLSSCIAKGTKPRPFSPKKSIVNDVIDALAAISHASRDKYGPPCWLQARDLNPREIIAFQNCLLHLPSGRTLDLTPDYFTRNALTISFDPTAPPPLRWLTFLDELFDDDLASIETLQEMFGYLIVCDVSQQKIFLFLGPRRSGKGTILRVLTMLVGAANVCGISLSSLCQNFGMQSLIGKQVAIVADMRIGPKTDQAAVVENLLRISGEDMVTIDRKYKDAWTGNLSVRFVLVSNEVPNITDVSGALVSRIIPIQMMRSFLGKEDVHLTNTLMTELPGIMLWAIEGWRRLQARGRFIVPTSAADVINTMQSLAAPVWSFVSERCVMDVAATISKDPLYTAYQSWCLGRGRPTKSKDVFCRDILALGNVESIRTRHGEERAHSFRGLRLREEAPCF